MGTPLWKMENPCNLFLMRNQAQHVTICIPPLLKFNNVPLRRARCVGHRNNSVWMKTDQEKLLGLVKCTGKSSRAVCRRLEQESQNHSHWRECLLSPLRDIFWPTSSKFSWVFHHLIQDFIQFFLKSINDLIQLIKQLIFHFSV